MKRKRPDVVPGAKWAMLAALAWTWFEFGRFLVPPMVPLILAGGLFLWWVSQSRKQWDAGDVAWLVLLGASAVGIGVAVNQFEAWLATKFFLLTLLGVCLPLQTAVSTPQLARRWLFAFVAVTLFVGAWAATHGGFGPARSDGQDENYVATMVVTGAGVAYFLLFAERSSGPRLLLVSAILASMAALAAADNPSRGGFVALIAVGAYALYRAPRRLPGLAVLGAAAIALALVAGDEFWAEIGSTTDYSEGTGDVRLELWKLGWRMWLANPVFGVGAGNFKWVIPDYQSIAQYEKFGRSLGGSIIAHSMHVELLAEFGLVGIAATGFLVWRTWQRLGRVLLPRRHRPRDPAADVPYRLSCYADAVRAALIAILVSGAFLSLLYYSYVWVFIAAGNGIAYVHRREQRRRVDSVERPPAYAPVPTHRLGQRPLSLPHS